MQNDTVLYRYYLKNDEIFLAHHLWGSHLPQPDAYGEALPRCAISWPDQSPEPLQKGTAPQHEDLLERAQHLTDEATSPPSDLEAPALPPLPGEAEAEASPSAP